jgi:hypothetical protein
VRALGTYLGTEQERRTENPDAGGFMTKHGWVSWQDFHDAQGKVEYVNGLALIRFPIRYDRDGYMADGTPRWHATYRDVPDYVLDEAEAQEVPS